MAGRWEVTRVRSSSGETGVKEVRNGDEEVDIGHVVSAGGWKMKRECLLSFLQND